MTPVVALLGLGVGAGLWLILTGLWGTAPRRTMSGARWRVLVGDHAGQRAAYAAAGMVALGATTQWPVAAMAGAGIGWYAPTLCGGRAARERAVARTEAIATWAESLLDTMSGAKGLEAALASTAPVAPEAIRPELTAFADRLYREPLPSALARLADDLAHPTADLVVTALSMAATGSVRDLGELLGALALAAREEAAMRLRVDATRGRMRTAVRVIAGCTFATAAGLVAFNPTYVEAYRAGLGQAVLALIAGIWGLGLWWLSRMSEFIAPDRFLRPRRAES